MFDFFLGESQFMQKWPYHDKNLKTAVTNAVIADHSGLISEGFESLMSFSVNFL